MYLANQYIQVPLIGYDLNNDSVNNVIPSMAYDLGIISDGLRKTIENVQQVASYVDSNDNMYAENMKDYVDNEIEIHTKRIAERTYDIISEMIDCNMRKEEFVKLLLSEESL